MKKVAIVDYHLGNLFSVNQALVDIGLNVLVTSRPEDLHSADAIILPGVGAFGDAMKNLEALQLIEPIKRVVAAGKPFLGICLGLQLLFTESTEFGSTKGLDLVKGVVKKFPISSSVEDRVKVPQIGWNQIFPENDEWSKSPLSVVQPGEYVYFVHSFYVVPYEEVTLTTTTYGSTTYVSSILKENVFACQFHPEKSGSVGLDIYKNWAQINNLL